MSQKKAVLTKKAPAPVGPYSQAIIHGNTLFISGQIPLNPETGKIVSGIINQTHQCCKNLLAIAAELGATADDFIKNNIYLTDMGNFPMVNQVYGQYFGGEVPPARACVEVRALPLNVAIEIEAIVALKEEEPAEAEDVEEAEEAPEE